jgi:hypothetical protein
VSALLLASDLASDLVKVSEQESVLGLGLASVQELV